MTTEQLPSLRYSGMTKGMHHLMIARREYPHG